MNASASFKLGRRSLCTLGTAALAALLPLLSPSPVNAAEGVEEAPSKWINRMHTAVVRKNYQGTLVRMRGTQVETFKVYHRQVGDNVSERLVGMDGDGFEVIQKDGETLCIFPAQQSVVVENSNSEVKSPMAAGLPAYDPALEGSYRFSVEEEGRVADRSCRALQIAAIDEYRYGYRIWIDTGSGMPLKSQLLSSNGKELIEEVMFTDIQILDEVPTELIQSAHNTENFSRVMPDEAPEGKDVDMPGWKAAELPPGFTLKTVRQEFLMGKDEPRLHLVYMDGLASVSVFVDKRGDEDREGFDMMGPTNAYTVFHDDWMVTAVGQVPPVTVEMIAGGMQQQ